MRFVDHCICTVGSRKEQVFEHLTRSVVGSCMSLPFCISYVGSGKGYGIVMCADDLPYSINCTNVKYLACTEIEI